MVMKKPIITSDLSFARDLCEGSAIYFNPIDKLDIVNKISLLMNSSKIQSNLISSGLKRVSEFPSATKRAEKIFEILLRLKENTNFKYE
jgi:glycosyltransferase involved in cell wall biosynthesis